MIRARLLSGKNWSQNYNAFLIASDKVSVYHLHTVYYWLHKTWIANRFRAKKPSQQTTGNFVLVCL